MVATSSSSCGLGEGVPEAENANTCDEETTCLCCHQMSDLFDHKAESLQLEYQIQLGPFSQKPRGVFNCLPLLRILFFKKTCQNFQSLHVGFPCAGHECCLL
jgi:hypothetical protein